MTLRETTEITSTLVVKKLGMKSHTAWRRIDLLRKRKEIKNRKPTIAEFCAFYKYDLGLFLTEKETGVKL